MKAARSIYEFEDYAKYLADWMKSRGLSHRQVAMMTGQGDVGVVNNLIRRRRPFTSELREAFAPLLGLDSDQKRYLELLVLRDEARDGVAERERELDQLRERGGLTIQQRNRVKALDKWIQAERQVLASYDEQIRGARAMAKARPLVADTLELLDHWSTFAIGELARCPGFEWSAGSILRRLPGAGTEARIRSALARLERCRVIARTGDGGGEYLRSPLVTPGPTDGKRLRSWYNGLLRCSRVGLDALFEDRWAWQRSAVGAATIALSPATLPKARALVEKLRLDLVALSEGQTEQPDEVYQMFVILFPVTASTDELRASEPAGQTGPTQAAGAAAPGFRA